MGAAVNALSTTGGTRSCSWDLEPGPDLQHGNDAVATALTSELHHTLWRACTHAFLMLLRA